jgi:hypothetical protein
VSRGPSSSAYSRGISSVSADATRVVQQGSSQADPFSLSQFSQEESATESRASKRARQMQMFSADVRKKEAQGRSRLTGASPSAEKKHAILANLDNIALTRDPLRVDEIGSIGDAKKLNLLECSICNDCPPKIPCVSRCGHVCCKTCWGKCLKLKSTCPVCRQETSASDIARVIVT